MTIQEKNNDVYERTYRYFACDFETTVFEGQQYTEVWAAAFIELWTEEPYVLHSIDEMFNYFFNLNDNLILYFHNEKFDGSFILPYLINKGYKQAFDDEGTILKSSKMPNNSFNYSISDMGQWYKITIKHNQKIIEIRDSLKLLPFSLRVIGKSFNTKHQKLDMEYKGFRYAGCEIPENDMEYIKNDVFVLKEALEIMFAQGHDKLTIGSCCMKEYMSMIDKWDWENDFPNLYELEIDKKKYSFSTAGEYVRASYRGGWTYLVHGKECKLYHNGVTFDVNSLYPSVMHSQSGSYYPVGKPTFWEGDTIPTEALREGRYYFIRVRTRFYLKKNKLPFIQIKHSPYYKPTECLETSDININGEYYQFVEREGEQIPTTVEMTLTCTDWELIKEHYYLSDCTILSGCWFYAKIGIFDEYINKYKEIKMNSKGAVRQIAKLFLNNLYGKMATSTDSSHKYAYLDDDSILQFKTVVENDKRPGYIPIGSAITSYARNFTIRAAQKNYYGKNKRGFIYADTDSIHCDLAPDEVKGVTIHPTDFCCWKCESCWDEGWYVRQKTYIEHVTHNDLEEVEPYYDIKCAGMPEKCKKRIIAKFNSETVDEVEGEKIPSDITEFNRGIKVFGKLMPRRIRGGTILVDTMYEMR